MPTTTSKRYPVELTLNQLVKVRDLVVAKANDLDYAVKAAIKGKVTVGEKVPSYYASAPAEARELFALYQAVTGELVEHVEALSTIVETVNLWDLAVEDSVDPDAD